MKIYQWILKFQALPLEKLLELYPPFLWMGMKITYLSKDFKTLEARVPLRWYVRNMHGTMFGGQICAATDPLPAMMCSRIFKNVDVWTKRHAVEFKRPARSDLTIKIQITDADLDQIRQELDTHRRCSYDFRFNILDQQNHIVARVRNRVFFRKRDE